MSIPVLSIAGRSNTGKTTLIEKLIPLLNSKGIRVATIKHHNHDFEIDHEGKDTYRHKRAGAKLAMIVAPGKLAFVEDLDGALSLDEILNRYIRDVDLVIIEGYKKEPGPKIEVYRCQPDLPPLAVDDEDIFAMITDGPFDPVICPAPSRVIPNFLRDEVDQISSFIIEKLGLLRD
jgi:molybdopterin-guanine dinucleotide biosynthesis adapter protein